MNIGGIRAIKEGAMMNGIEKQGEFWEDQRAQADRQELVELIRRAIPEDGKVEPIAGLVLQRASAPGEPLYVVTAPSFCVIAQGSKEIILRNESYTYDPFHYLLVTAELPLTGTIREASPEHPYLSLRLILDPALVHSVMVEARDAS
ncbi:MAG: AraC family transcriptional regulator, partial [candidate division KSB1 bacterium]|nr:AraC family transcriptional regulator [candidate division KSB1 bacterium]